MELPKNIVQIGNPDKHCKVFVEDYVVSYIKQINRSLRGGQAGIALFGKKYTEGDIRYYFLYGATDIKGLDKRGVYLSDMEKEQIEHKRMEFFEEQEFLAWCTLTGEMPDGFYLLEQGKGLLIKGYATFFEKNDNMLNFMIIMKNREKDPDDTEGVRIDLEKRGNDYEWGRLAEGGNIDHRLLERSQKLSEVRKAREGYRKNVVAHRRADKYERAGTWKTLLTGVAVMLCVIGIATLSDEEKMKNIQTAARQIMAGISEQKLPDAEDEIFDAVELQSELLDIEVPISEPENETDTAETLQPEPQTEIQPKPQPESQTEPAADVQTGASPEEVQEVHTIITDNPQPTVGTTAKTVTYVVEKGDMLLTICRQRYGSDERIKEICELNGIQDPDDIKVGQIILLPE